MINLYRIAPDKVHDIWHKVAPLLDKAIKRSIGEHNLDTLKIYLVDAKMQLWVGDEDGQIIHAGVTNVITHPTGLRVCEISYLGGERMKEWEGHHMDILVDWAARVGCKRVNIIGRPGWKKIRTDYEQKYAILTKVLT